MIRHKFSVNMPARFKAGDHWWFLTGKKDAVYALAREGFKLPIAEATPGGAGIVHSTRLILVDRQGVVRGLYDGLSDGWNTEPGRPTFAGC